MVDKPDGTVRIELDLRARNKYVVSPKNQVDDIIFLIVELQGIQIITGLKRKLKKI